MLEFKNLIKNIGNRRSFLKTGITAAGAATIGGGMLGSGSPAFGQAVPSLNMGQHTAIPRTDADTAGSSIGSDLVEVITMLSSNVISHFRGASSSLLRVSPSFNPTVRNCRFRSLLVGTLSGILSISALAQTSSTYVQTNIISNAAAPAALKTDPTLINPWGRFGRPRHLDQ